MAKELTGEIHKNMSFKVGQRVVCIEGCGHWSDDTGEAYDGPSKNEETVIDRIMEDGYLMFEEYPHNQYDPDSFRPIVPIKAKVKASFPQPVEERVDELVEV